MSREFQQVVNPQRNQVGLFRWENGGPVNQEGFYIVGNLPNHGLDQAPQVFTANSL